MMTNQSWSSKSTPTVSPAPSVVKGTGECENRESSSTAAAVPNEPQETLLERQLKEERRHLMFKVDDISKKHQALLRANIELSKKNASLEAELQHRQALFFSNIKIIKNVIARLFWPWV